MTGFALAGFSVFAGAAFIDGCIGDPWRAAVFAVCAVPLWLLLDACLVAAVSEASVPPLVTQADASLTGVPGFASPTSACPGTSTLENRSRPVVSVLAGADDGAAG